MNDPRETADRTAIEALRAEYSDAAMMLDHERFASLFTDDGVMVIPDAGIEHRGRAAILDGATRLRAGWEFMVQTTHPGVVELHGDTATGRAYIQELGRLRDGRSIVNYALFHDRYQRTPQGWKFTERVYEVRYLDTSTLGGSPPPYPKWADAAVAE
ncbi:DUF4440 domain-containing protein [Actinophytocola xinjiangensis]|uniref:DUF4440 domain-containing protein n=1 Tax=Actinophytocola xinjiangensis TaxID=485602 RepID=A0A7Z1AUL2_9PSEU|nr:nuclear transport factor 2 family protein [Actinophytocola xinjiangensis]OLF05732.1 DUF4440 domain-containing protein [Actinophytocola xinjiangensis]